MTRRQRTFLLATAGSAVILSVFASQRVDIKRDFLSSAYSLWSGPRAILGDVAELGQDLIATPNRQEPPAVPLLEAGDAGAKQPPAAISAPVEAPPPDMTGFAESIAFYKKGNLERGDEAAETAKEEIVKTALEWVALRRLPRAAGFERLQKFAAAHPDWPGLAWLRSRSEEALFGDRKNPALIKSFFAGGPPLTPAGRLALAGALIAEGKTDEAAALVRTVWREADLNNWLEAKIRSDYLTFLDRADHKYRADRLLYKKQTAAALRAASLAGPDVLALAKARAAIMAGGSSDKLLAAVPAALRSDPGYIFAQVQKYRRAEKIKEAVDLLLAAPREPELVVNGDEWWVERRLLARKLLDQDDFETAYRLCAEHAAMTVPTKIEAEFHAGWIALRFLNDAERAAPHFAKAAEIAETPISKARTAYWQGRAAEALAVKGLSAEAQAFYEKAAVHAATFYGQLARAKLGLTTLPIRTIEDEAQGAERHESIRVIEMLYAQGEAELARSLAMEAARDLPDERQMAALASVIAAQNNAQLSLTIGKLASYRGFALDTLAFPVYGVPPYEPLENSAPKSVVYSIARQESAFNSKAVSSAGAKGLMQMMTATARNTAKRASVAFNESRLINDAAFNAQLGAAHLGDLLNEQRGSYILAFAAYNAGGGRVKQWIEAYGDPRKPDVDPIDWIERIPFTETRNYVQRVSENLAVYRVRFGEHDPHGFEPILQAQAKL
jgi:soluble lytic murein transglycosylase